jgi:hypothetical protein
MDQSPPSEDDNHSLSQEFSSLMESKDLSPSLQEPTIGPYPEQDQSSSHITTIFP